MRSQDDSSSNTGSQGARPLRKGRLLRRALRDDPTQEYLLYVPSTLRENAVPLVSVHGVSRNADEHARLFSAYCEMYGILLIVPLFTVEEHGDYQRLGRQGRGKRSDLALNAIVAEATRIADAASDRFNLFRSGRL